MYGYIYGKDLQTYYDNYEETNECMCSNIYNYLIKYLYI